MEQYNSKKILHSFTMHSMKICIRIFCAFILIFNSLHSPLHAQKSSLTRVERGQLTRAGITSPNALRQFTTMANMANKNTPTEDLAPILISLFWNFGEVKTVNDLLSECARLETICKAVCERKTWKTFKALAPAFEQFRQHVHELDCRLTNAILVGDLKEDDEITVASHSVLPLDAGEEVLSNDTSLTSANSTGFSTLQRSGKRIIRYINKNKATTIMLGSAIISFAIAGMVFPLHIPKMLATATASAGLNWAFTKYYQRQTKQTILRENTIQSGAWSIVCSAANVGFFLPVGGAAIGIVTTRIISGATLSGTAQLVRATDQPAVGQGRKMLKSIGLGIASTIACMVGAYALEEGQEYLINLYETLNS